MTDPVQEAAAGTPLTAEDERQIRHATARYCRGVDRGNAELIKTAYWPDAQDHHGIFDGNAHAFADFIVPYLNRIYTGTIHLLGQSLIDGGAHIAVGETYFMSSHGVGAGAGRLLDQASGRYLDRFERRGADWRIVERFVVLDILTRVPGPEFDNNGDTRRTMGETGPGDLSCQHFPWSWRTT